jgi:hypothetical protein
MKCVWGMTLLMGAGVGLYLAPQQALAQACKDEAGMVDATKQTVMELTDKVKKESLTDFEDFNHQKNAVTKLTVYASMLGDLVSCLDKAAQDSTAAKDATDAAKTQHDAYAKLLEKVQQVRGNIKGAQASKDAKPLVEGIDLAP